MESTQAERAEVDIPFAVVDLDESDMLLAQDLTDIDPLLVPADPASAILWTVAATVRGATRPPPTRAAGESLGRLSRSHLQEGRV
jgi:hypothetical protein